jgi:hypothetical protein
MAEEAPILEQKKDESPISSEDPADAAVQSNKKKRLCRHPVSAAAFGNPLATLDHVGGSRPRTGGSGKFLMSSLQCSHQRRKLMSPRLSYDLVVSRVAPRSSNRRDTANDTAPRPSDAR